MTILQARRYQIKGNYQPLDADLTAVAASGVASAWTAYTPTVTAGSGAITTLGAVSGRYIVMGKITFVQMFIPITTNGTGAIYVAATLPSTAAVIAVLAGREGTLTGKAVAGTVQASAASVRIVFYDNTYPGANGAGLIVSGCYENA